MGKDRILVKLVVFWNGLINKTARILDVKYFILLPFLLPSVHYVGTTLDELQWIALLKSASAYEMYRKHSHQHRINPKEVTSFLILDW